MVDYYFFKDHEGRIAPAPPVRAQRCCAPLYAPLAVGLMKIEHL